MLVTVIQPQTSRLLLRQWTPEDRLPFAFLNADAGVMRYFPKPLNADESDAVAARAENGIRERGWGFWAVEVRGGEPFIGLVGISPVPDDMPFAPGVEIGWRLAREHWGKGYATEAARAALQVAFETLLLPEILAFAVAANMRSLAVMKRLGMERGDDFDHPNLPVGNPLRRHALYRLSAERWRAMQRTSLRT